MCRHGHHEHLNKKPSVQAPRPLQAPEISSLNLKVLSFFFFFSIDPLPVSLHKRYFIEQSDPINHRSITVEIARPYH